MQVSDSVEAIKGVGVALAKKLSLVGIKTVDDALRYYPRRYQDYSQITPISKLRPGEVSIQGEFKQVKGRYVRRGMHITEGILSDKTSSVRVTWFNQPYRANSIKPGEQYFVSGKFELSRTRMQIMNPSVEPATTFPINTARIVPIYPEKRGISSNDIRRVLRTIFIEKPPLASSLTPAQEKQYKLGSLHEALQAIHFPKDSKAIERAKHRIGFEEVYELIVAHMILKREAKAETALLVPFDRALAQKFVKHLPFKLTDAQRIAVWETYQDIAEGHPMNRLIEGDVGSGKTVIATMATAMTVAEGMQVAVMAPTEILARQHAKTMFELLEPLGQAPLVCLLVGSMTAQQKKLAYENIASGKAKCIIGTHSLIQDKLDMHKLALVIIDEQHRFGVEQRKKLLKKTGHMPHLMSMTATPIPRSLALTVYGDLDISILRDKPPGRKDIETELILPQHRLEQYKKIDTTIEAGQQVFVVCPLIEDSAVVSAKSVTKVYAELTKLLPMRRIGLLHGKLKADEKQSIMQDFVDKKLDMLVSTTVIEVGVDVPNATIMCIEAPERFGLAQIHQLRGRVGRGGHQGYCYLMLSDDKAPSKRMRAVSQSSDGFRLSELDLELRGPGAIYGTMQHGALDLRMADLSDVALIKQARSAAQEVLKEDENLLQYPQLQKRIQQLQKIVHLN